MGRQTVHNNGRIRGVGKQGIIHLKAAKDCQPFVFFPLLTHGGPDIDIDHIGLSHGLLRTAHQNNGFSPITAPFFEDFRIGIVAFRTGQNQLKTQDFCGLNPRVGDIIAITHPGNLQIFQGPFLLNHGHQIAHDLTGMMEIGQGIDHRHR